MHTLSTIKLSRDLANSLPIYGLVVYYCTEGTKGIPPVNSIGLCQIVEMVKFVWERLKQFSVYWYFS